jgi:hypothetical protein
MKAAIEEAIENGFDITKGSLGITLGKQELISDGSFTWVKNEEGELYMINFYQIIFGTDFIDKLTEGKCFYARTKADEICSTCDGRKSFVCSHKLLAAVHHRRELANKTLTEMKDYIRRLV